MTRKPTNALDGIPSRLETDFVRLKSMEDVRVAQFILGLPLRGNYVNLPTEKILAFKVVLAQIKEAVRVFQEG